MVTFGEYVTNVWAYCPPSQRRGQWAFNLLHVYRPTLANMVRGTQLDPFYQDETIPAEFWTFVHEHWDREQ